MPRPPCADDMSQQLSALRQQLLQTGETEEVAAVLLPRMIELLFTPPAWAIPDPAVTMPPSSHTVESLLLHSKASSRFLEILRQQKPPPSANLIAALLRAAAAILAGSDNPVSRVWLDMLLEAIDILPVETMQSEILPIAVHQSQAWNNTWARISACHLFGKVCVRMDPPELHSEVIPGLVALCQDVAWEVRSAACDQLAHAASCFRASPLLLSTLCELGADESEAVLVSVVGATASSLRNLTPDTLVSAITPLVMRLAREAAKEGSPVLIALATHYGDLCHGLKGYMSPEERRWLVDMFQNMVRMGLQRISDTMFKHVNLMMLGDDNMVRWTQQVRCLAAASLPAVSQFLLSEDRRDVLLGIVRDLVFDPHPPVRCSLASGLHKIAVVLGVESCGLLKYDFTRLLCDQNLDVLRALMPTMAPILLFMKEGKILSPNDLGIKNVAACTEILKGLLTCEATVGATLDWRLYIEVTTQYEVLPQCMPSDIIYDTVISLLQQRILSVRQLPSRCALSRAILKLLKFNERPEHRDDIRNKLVENLMRNKNSYHRMCYLRLCRVAMEIFSAAYFKTWFFNNVISLSEDSVATVRQVSAELFPSLKNLCKIPEDKRLLEMLDSAVNQLLKDSDKEVVSVAKIVHKKLKEVEVVSATAEADLMEKQRLEEEIAVEQRKPPESWLQGGSLMSDMINKSRTSRDLQPLLKMSVPMPICPQSISTLNDMLFATQDTTFTQPRTNQFPQPSCSARADSGSTGSSQVLQRQDFVIDAGIRLPGKQTTHIPSPRRGHSQQSHHQNRRSWAGSSCPKSRGQADQDALLQGLVEIDLLDIGQSDSDTIAASQDATAGAHNHSNPLLQNMKPTGIARGVIHSSGHKDRLGPSKVPTGKPGRTNCSLLGSPVIMRSGRGRGSRDIAHRNSVAAIPVRNIAENVQSAGRQGEGDGKTSTIRRRSGQFSGGKTGGSSRGTQYALKRNSAIEIHLENSRGKDHFTGRRSATFEGLADYNSTKTVTHAQRSSPQIPVRDQEKSGSLSISVPNISVQNDEMQNAEGNIKVAASETTECYENEITSSGKLDTNKRLLTRVSIYGKVVEDVAIKQENNFEENMSLMIKEPKVQFDGTKICIVTDEIQETTLGESNKTAIISGCPMEKGDGEKAVHNSIICGKVEARNVRKAKASGGSQITFMSALDKQGSKNKTSINNDSHKVSNEKKGMDYLPVREVTGSPENQSDYSNPLSKGLIKCKIPPDKQMEDVEKKQQIAANMPDEIFINASRKTSVNKEFSDEQGVNFSHVVKRDSKMAVPKSDRRNTTAEKMSETVKQISRRSFNLDHYAALRPSEGMHLLGNSSPAIGSQPFSSMSPTQRRISTNRHSFGAVLATPLPPRRHSSLDRLGGPRSDPHEEGSGTSRGSSCRSSPTSGLPASKLPILRRQHPP